MADEIVSLLGDTLVPPPVPDDSRAKQEAALATARAELAEHPDDPDALIWLGRRTAYLGNYRDAVQIFSDGIDQYPHDPRFYRHRGHRFITLRRFEEAVVDFETATDLIAGRPDETEPDGQPNRRNLPTSTLHSNIWYHLALARYLQGDLDRAQNAWWACRAVSANPDMLVAASHWLYMTLRRLGRDGDAARVLAPIREDLDVIENGAYHRLLLMYQGTLSPDDLLAPTENTNTTLHDSTAGYGIANWHLYNGRKDEATSWFRRIYDGPQWAAFGYIAAEAELAR